MKTKYPFICKLFFTFLFITVSVQGFSQTPEFAPIGAKWWYAYKAEFSFNVSYYMYEAVKDTVIDGENAVRINASIVSTEDSIYKGYEYFKKDSTQIAVYRNDVFHTLINYNAEPGDTITVLNENFEAFFFPELSSFELYNFSYAIDSIGFELLDGDEHKIFYIKNLNESDYTFYDVDPKIIESLGAVSGFCMIGLPSDIAFTNPAVYGLVCYTDKFRTLSFNGFSCDTLFSGISNFNVASAIQMFPNPANNTFTISISEFDLAKQYVFKAWAMNGSLIAEITLNAGLENIITIEEWSSGIYLCEVSADGEIIFTEKFIKE